MKTERFLALDVLRGLTVAFMIIVNTPGNWDAVYAPLLHANWHGFTPTDLVFPTFLFCVGNAMSFTLRKYAALGSTAFLGKTLRRSVLIFALGVLLYWLPFFKFDAGSGQWLPIAFADTRIPGVLQRIALCYCAASLLLYYLSESMVKVFCACALPTYWALLAAFGDLSLAGNAARQFDLALLGAAHLYKGEGIAFDPEGLLGTLPATVNVVAGYFAGNFLRQGADRAKLRRLLLAGAVFATIGLIWHPLLPINKKLWTSSYVMLGIGLDLLLLAALVQIVDIYRWRRLAWLAEVFGRNTMAIYLLSEVLVIVLITIRVGKDNAYDWLYKTAFLPLAGSYNGSLLFAFAALVFCWLLAWYLDRKKWYFKL